MRAAEEVAAAAGSLHIERLNCLEEFPEVASNLDQEDSDGDENRAGKHRRSACKPSMAFIATSRVNALSIAPTAAPAVVPESMSVFVGPAVTVEIGACDEKKLDVRPSFHHDVCHC